MNSEKIPSSQLTAWLFAAVVPAAIQLTAGASWLSVLLVALICLLCVSVRWRWGITPTSKGYAVALWILMTLLLGAMSGEVIKCWPTGGHAAVPIILLALALWASCKGASAAARVGCVFFWFFLFMYLVLIGGGLKDVRVQWLNPIRSDVGALGCVLLLTPAVATTYLKKGEKIKPGLILVSIVCVAAAVITAGVLSPQVAITKENAFYEMTRSLTLLGKARRFEAVLSAGTTIGWFVLMCLYLTICGKMAEMIREGWKRKGVTVAALIAAVCVLCELHIPHIILLVSAAVFWVLVPLWTQAVDRIKKS